MRFEFHPEALEEYNEAANRYASKEPGLDLRFIVSIETAIERILEDPNRWRIVDGDVRRYLTHVFPYAILYANQPEFVLIIAVAHYSREPGY